MTAATGALLRAPASWPRWAILLVTALAARAATFGDPIVHVDEEFYFLTAQRWLEGAIPYVGIWDRKPIGLFLIYLPPAMLGAPLGVWAYQAMALACVVFTALLIARIADRAGWRAGSTIGAALYILFLNMADGQGGQSPIFYNLMVAGAFALVLPGEADRLHDWRRVARAMVAMLLFGLAMQVKYSAVFEGMFLGLWLLWREHRLGGSPVRLAALAVPMVVLAVGPTGIAWWAYAAIGHGEAFWYANFGSIFERRSDPWFRLLGNFLKCAAVLGPLLYLAGRSWRMSVDEMKGGEESEAQVRTLAFGWLGAALFGFLVFGSWFSHYTLPVMVPAALCAGAWLGGSARGQRWALPVLLGSLIVGQAFVISSIMIRGTGSQIAAFSRAIGSGPGCLYVYSGNSALYSYTGRCHVTRWIFPSHLTRDREQGAIGIDQPGEVDRIFAQRPQFVVMRPLYIGELPEVRARAIAHLKAGGYRLKGQWPVGNLMLDLYEAQATAASTR
ncbi:hypothetical protein P1X14_15685 [Sphingomonas sp. AOB5]|uniref:hypothetical protein n=1 Tax=Sphingomonas sp. AOB5 TaxID=3034017 RepID=UPI0023F6AFCD|nr:hypothetical protein [Sphingomonas sp. AOB5]MDF7776699.1 hypothetical protein [Sphingomonas sp. AOB5]